MTLEGKPPLTFKRRLENVWLRLQRDWRIYSLNQQVKRQANPDQTQKPVAIFNASTRLAGFSQNAAFNLLTTWGLQLADIPIVHFSCQAGMSRCVLGTNLDDHNQEPPCAACMAQSRRVLRSSDVHGFSYQEDSQLAADLQNLTIDQLSNYKLTVHNSPLNIGALVLPSLRWSLRRHHLKDDESTRFLLREYIKSAYHVGLEFGRFLDEVDPQMVLVFNGTMFPEAIARWVAKQRGLRVTTHEVGFQPFSTFFTDGEATAYPMQIPDDFELNSAQNEKLDAYLSQRFKGEFTMAGIRFWPEISGLDEEFLAEAEKFEQIVPVFTNVINDTSQVHACTVFDEMYDWLAHVVEIIMEHPETLFVIRAHPDEKRIGTHKHSRQPVSDWVADNDVLDLPNVLFVDAFEPLSSYDLMQRSKFIIVYNSSIGLEASLMGVPVLCGGKARYTQYPTVFFPQTKIAYQDKAREFLTADEIQIPSEFQRNARRVLYWQLFRSAMPLKRYLRAHPTPGYVQLKPFTWRDLLPENSQSITIIIEGLLEGKPFVLPEDQH